ncbi:MAG: aspartate/glutamate racemase family protein [Candidatus Pelethousia sp.]|nr:aspartate/glutamate racemase family protein [Candidatus Pelethousia sp.]
MKIMVINPNSSKTMTSHLNHVLNAIKNADTQLTVVCPEEAPPAIESAYDEAVCIPYVLKLVEQAAADGYDAAILACFSDPGLEPAREVTDMLVMGIEETSMHVAAMLGAKFTILTLNKERVPHKAKEARRFMLENSLASVRPLGMSVAETDADPERTRAKIREVARLAKEEDGAEVVLLGCAGMAGYAEGITEELGLAVIDPSSVTLKVTEAMVASGLKQAKCGFYSTPPSRKRVNPKGCC